MALAQISETNPRPEPRRFRPPSVENQPERLELTAQFRQDLRMDRPQWERLIAWLKERSLSAQYTRGGIPFRHFELTFPTRDEEQIAEFLETFQPDRHTVRPLGEGGGVAA